ncbi:MAG: EmrB/QacA family drug resistance transporter, partial [Proteobacteria bacterium]|nr:EmrB/QacA family drug resistance transporter [Pseudomonadota bacterium]
TLDPSHRTEAASMWNLIRSAGSSIGISVGIFFLTRMGATSRAELTEHVNPFNLMFELPQVAGRWSTETLTDLARLDLEITRQAMMVGYIDVFYMFAFAAAIALPAVFLLAKPAPRG